MTSFLVYLNKTMKKFINIDILSFIKIQIFYKIIVITHIDENTGNFANIKNSL